jgi:hypothetical protein
MANKTVYKSSSKGGVSGGAVSARPGVPRGRNTGKSKRSGSEAKARASVRPKAPTQEQIAERAKLIWQEHGCVLDQDESNWFEAEAQLKAEIAVG